MTTATAIPQVTDAETRQRQLERMKRRATGLLVLMTLVFLVARWFEPDHHWLGYVRATAEAAQSVREGALEHREDAPRLGDALSTLDAGALSAIESRLAGALDERGGLSDRASPELGRLRRALAMARQGQLLGK